MARATQIDSLGDALRAEQQRTQQAERLAQERRQAVATLSALLDRPVDADDWRAQAAESYRLAVDKVGDDAASAQALEAEAQRLRQVLDRQVQATTDLDAAVDLAGFGLDLFPGDPALAKSRQRLLDQQAKLNREAQTQAQRIERSKARVAGLLAKPLGTAVWLQDLRSATGEARKAIGVGQPELIALEREVDAGIQSLARQRIREGQFDDAARLARAGQQIGTDDAGHAAVLAEIETARSAARAEADKAQAAKAVELRQKLAALLADPKLDADWQRAVSTALDTVRQDRSPEAQALVDSLGSRIAARVATLKTPETLPQARQALEFGLKRQPKSAALLAERARIDQLQREVQAKIDRENAEAEVKSRIESVKRAAAANDTQKAQQSLARIRALQPDNVFLKTEGPMLVGDAYVRLAENAFTKGKWSAAADTIAQAQRSLPPRADFAGLKARYDLVAAIKGAGDGPLDQTRYDALSRQLATTRRLDPTALERLEAAMANAGRLKEKSLAAALERIRPRADVAPAPAPPPAAVEPAPAPVVPAPRVEPAKPAVPVPAPAPTVVEEEESFVATGPDPCNKPALFGTGRACFDALLGTRRGPRLAVVPGLGGGKPYALTRTEVTVANFNEYCNATARCAAKAVSGSAEANAPVVDISLAQAQAYAKWLTKASGGYVYRLPTDAEWLHAARGGGGFKQAENSNCVLPGSQPGGGMPLPARGRDPNPWGLVHMSGNVWEWVVDGGRVAVRGAGFNDYWSDCTVDAKREHDGGPRNDIGFRVLRELR